MKKTISTLTVVASLVMSANIFAAPNQQNQCISNIKDHQITADMLSMTDCGITDKDLPAIVTYASEHPELKMLSLDYNSITSDGVKSLTALKGLEILDLAHNQIDADGAKLLAESPNTSPSLYLGDNPIQTEGVVALATSNVSRLGLDNIEFDRKAINAIINNTHITSLSLSGTRFTKDDVLALTNRKLVGLAVSNMHLGDAFIERLSQETSLVDLILDGNDLTAASAVALSTLPNLMYLSISDNPIGDAGFSALFNGPLKSSLSHLWALNIGLNDAGLMTLANIENLSLRYLVVMENSVTQAAVDALSEHGNLYVAWKDYNSNDVLSKRMRHLI